MNRLIIIGAGGHGRVCAEIAELCGYRDIAFLDDSLSEKLNIIDFETLNQAIEDLADVVEPLAKFFNVFN